MGNSIKESYIGNAIQTIQTKINELLKNKDTSLEALAAKEKLAQILKLIENAMRVLSYLDNEKVPGFLNLAGLSLAYWSLDSSLAEFNIQSIQEEEIIKKFVVNHPLGLELLKVIIDQALLAPATFDEAFTFLAPLDEFMNSVQGYAKKGGVSLSHITKRKIEINGTTHDLDIYYQDFLNDFVSYIKKFAPLFNHPLINVEAEKNSFLIESLYTEQYIFNKIIRIFSGKSIHLSNLAVIDDIIDQLEKCKTRLQEVFKGGEHPSYLFATVNNKTQFYHLATDFPVLKEINTFEKKLKDSIYSIYQQEVEKLEAYSSPTIELNIDDSITIIEQKLIGIDEQLIQLEKLLEEILKHKLALESEPRKRDYSHNKYQDVLARIATLKANFENKLTHFKRKKEQFKSRIRLLEQMKDLTKERFKQLLENSQENEAQLEEEIQVRIKNRDSLVENLSIGSRDVGELLNSVELARANFFDEPQTAELLALVKNFVILGANFPLIKEAEKILTLCNDKKLDSHNIQLLNLALTNFLNLLNIQNQEKSKSYKENEKNILMLAQNFVGENININDASFFEKFINELKVAGHLSNFSFNGGVLSQFTAIFAHPAYTFERLAQIKVALNALYKTTPIIKEQEIKLMADLKEFYQALFSTTTIFKMKDIITYYGMTKISKRIEKVQIESLKLLESVLPYEKKLDCQKDYEEQLQRCEKLLKVLNDKKQLEKEIQVILVNILEFIDINEQLTAEIAILDSKIKDYNENENSLNFIELDKNHSMLIEKHVKLKLLLNKCHEKVQLLSDESQALYQITLQGLQQIVETQESSLVSSKTTLYHNYLDKRIQTLSFTDFRSLSDIVAAFDLYKEVKILRLSLKGAEQQFIKTDEQLALKKIELLEQLKNYIHNFEIEVEQQKINAIEERFDLVDAYIAARPFAEKDQFVAFINETENAEICPEKDILIDKINKAKASYDELALNLVANLKKNKFVNDSKLQLEAYLEQRNKHYKVKDFFTDTDKQLREIFIEKLKAELDNYNKTTNSLALNVLLNEGLICHKGESLPPLLRRIQLGLKNKMLHLDKNNDVKVVLDKIINKPFKTSIDKIYQEIALLKLEGAGNLGRANKLRALLDDFIINYAEDLCDKNQSFSFKKEIFLNFQQDFVCQLKSETDFMKNENDNMAYRITLNILIALGTLGGAIIGRLIYTKLNDGYCSFWGKNKALKLVDNIEELSTNVQIS